MKVAIIGHKQIPGRSGGVEVVVEELATRLAAMGFDVTAYNRKARGAKSPARLEGVRLVDVPTPDNKELNAAVYSYLATALAVAWGADVIHYHALGPAASLWLAKLFGKKVVVTVHGLNYKTPKWKGLGSRYIKFGERLSMRRADEVVVLSRAIQSYYESEYGRSCRFLPNGLDMPERVADDSILDRLGIRGRDFLLCVSRLVPGKGLEALVEAYGRVAADAQLVIAGDSDHVEDFKRALRESARGDGRIRFVGFTGKRDLCALYASARLFVLPSEAEGMPMSLLEAMWFDCPCLVSDIPENTEVLEGHGYTFRVGDVDDLAARLAELTSPFPGRQETRRLVAQNHDWDRVADATAQIYEEVISPGTEPGGRRDRHCHSD